MQRLDAGAGFVAGDFVALLDFLEFAPSDKVAVELFGDWRAAASGPSGDDERATGDDDGQKGLPKE